MAPKKELRVLLVEDDPDDALLLQEALKESGGPNRYALQTATSLKAALAALGRASFDVALADLMLPDSRGLETFLRLRGARPDVPFIVLTGMNDEALALEAVRLGAQDYLVKGAHDPLLIKRALSYAVERGALVSQLESIIENAADGMVVVDAKGLVHYINPAAEAMFGKDAEAFIGKPFPLPVSPNAVQEIRLPSRNGEHVAEVRVNPMVWKKQPAFLASIRDITDLRRVEQLKAEIKERRRIDQLKDEFLNTVSHELRTPLSILKAAVENLKEGLLGPLSKKQENVVEMAHRNLERLARIVNDLLDLSRLESGKAVAERKKLEPGPLIREIARSFSTAEDGRELDVSIKIDSEIPAVYADPDLFVQVLMNLLDNARRYAKSRIDVRAGASRGGVDPEGWLHVTISDDGPGIPQQSRSELFSKFTQINRPRGGGGYKGTGLGLAISKQILDLHGGRIWVDRGEGKGATFHFTIPDIKSAAVLTAKESRDG